MTNETDENNYLWARIQKSDKDMFQSIFEYYYPTLCQFAKRYIDEKEAREDIVQDVFVKLWEDRKKIFIKTTIRSYLFVCIKNQCLNYLQHAGHVQRFIDIEMADLSLSEEEVYTLKELEAMLEAALEKLPETYRSVFKMHKLEGKDYMEIANELNISERTAKRYQAKVIEILKEDLKDYLPIFMFLLNN